MNPAILIPTPDAIPVGWGWFEGLNVLTFALHMIFVNVLVGGGVLVLYLNMKKRYSPVVDAFSKKLPTTFALAVNLGVAPLLFLQVLYGHFFYTSSILAAGWWLAIILMLIGGYYALYIYQALRKNKPSTGNYVLVVGLGLTLCIALILTSVFTMMLKPEIWGEFVGGSQGTALNLTDPTMLPRFLHFIFASLAVGGLALGLQARFGSKADAAMTAEIEKKGLKVFTISTLLQMASGIWWLIVLDRHVMLSFMGDNSFATGVFMVALAFSVASLFAGIKNNLIQASVWTGLTVLVMAIVRAVLRSETLSQWFSPSTLTVTGEVSPLVLFLVSFGIGTVVLIYMLRLAFRPQKEG